MAKVSATSGRPRTADSPHEERNSEVDTGVRMSGLSTMV
jgi:hypothetical protein